MKKINNKNFTSLTANDLQFLVQCFPATADDSINNDLLYAVWSIFRNIDSTSNQNSQTVTFDFETNKNVPIILCHTDNLFMRKPPGMRWIETRPAAVRGP